LIRKMSVANVGWGSPRIVGELRKLGIDIAKSTVEKYRVCVFHAKPATDSRASLPPIPDEGCH
jgi:hypothetical protein